MSSKGWLPELLKWNGSDWPNYIEKVFGLFDEGFISSKAMFRGQEVRLRWMPVHEGKPSAFWHLVQEGKIEQDRTPDLRRCERIEWLRAIIDHSDDAAVKVWENERRGSGGVQRQVLLWLEEEDFLVVLGKRHGYFLLLTAYTTNREHTRRKLRDECAASIQTGKS
jgi:hypothetical protein